MPPSPFVHRVSGLCGTMFFGASCRSTGSASMLVEKPSGRLRQAHRRIPPEEPSRPIRKPRGIVIRRDPHDTRIVEDRGLHLLCAPSPLVSQQTNVVRGRLSEIDEAPTRFRSRTDCPPVQILLDPIGTERLFDSNIAQERSVSESEIAQSSNKTVSLMGQPQFDLSGRLIDTLADGPMGAGSHLVEWDGRDSAGMLLPCGVYLYRLAAGSEILCKAMLFVP